MTDKKLTDSEIIKALECCPKSEMICDCKALKCPNVTKRGCKYILNGDCDRTTSDIIIGLSTDALDLINRQKAEIERLWTCVCELKREVAKHEYNYDPSDETQKIIENIMGEDGTEKFRARIKTEAYKEFAETAIDRVEKAKAKYQRLCKEQGEEMEEHMHIHFNGIIGIINKLLKELVGENNGN